MNLDEIEATARAVDDVENLALVRVARAAMAYASLDHGAYGTALDDWHALVDALAPFRETQP